MIGRGGRQNRSEVENCTTVNLTNRVLSTCIMESAQPLISGLLGTGSARVNHWVFFLIKKECQDGEDKSFGLPYDRKNEDYGIVSTNECSASRVT